jgi:YidC/Oxa1 family membrane protein insertase
VTTDVLRLTFDTEGGSLVRSEFLKHTDLPTRMRASCCSTRAPAASIWRRPGLIGGRATHAQDAHEFSAASAP